MSNGIILSAISNTQATSSAGLKGDLCIPTDIKSNKIFHIPNRVTAPDSDVCKIEHELWDPAQIVDMVLDLVDSSPLRTSKLACACHIKIYDVKDVNIYDINTTIIIVPEEAVLRGWRCPKSTLCHIPRTQEVKHLNTDTLLLHSTDVQHSLNSMYEFPHISAMIEHLVVFMQDIPLPQEAINNVYELSSIAPAL